MEAGESEQVGAGFARGVRRGRLNRGRFGEAPGLPKRAVNFVRGDVMKAVAVKFLLPGSAACFQQVEGPHDIGLDEIGGAGD